MKEKLMKKIQEVWNEYSYKGTLETYSFYIEQAREDGDIIYIGFIDKRKKSLYMPEKVFDKILESLFTEENILKYGK